MTFIFVVLVLQLIYIYTGSYPPMTNADRIIRLESFYDAEGKERIIRSSETDYRQQQGNSRFYETASKHLPL